MAGIAYLDNAFGTIAPEPLYEARRQRLTLVGISCEPDEYCFCGDVDASVPSKFDVFLQDEPEGFRVIIASARGEEIIAPIASLLEDREDTYLAKQACPFDGKIRSAAKRGETFAGSRLWEEFAARCLSCGACSLCCPTCYCFDLHEYATFGGKTAERIREWDNCLFMEFGEVAGGFNFRKNRRERFHYRHQHKYLGFGPTRGVVACVGCGRCREVCPVRIDLLDLFREEENEEH